MIPCPEQWQYVPDDGCCYKMLSRWKEFSWQQANEECKILSNESSLWNLDEDDVGDVAHSIFAAYKNEYFWVGGKYSSGMIGFQHFRFHFLE